MKTLASALLFSASLLASGAYASTPADTPEGGSPATFQTSSVSRANVVADLNQAKANGEVAYAEADAPFRAVASSGTTRAQIAAAAAQARANGQLSFGESNNRPFQG